MQKCRLLVFASGTKDAGGSGFKNLVTVSRQDNLSFEVVAVVSNHPHGGVFEKADDLKVPFFHFPAPWDEAGYARIIASIPGGIDRIALSGWMKKVRVPPPQEIGGHRIKDFINIHPGNIFRFGGDGMHGHHVHERVMDVFDSGEAMSTAVCMHFLDNSGAYDTGPVFFYQPVPIFEGDMANTLGTRVLRSEHFYQPMVTDRVIRGEISWDGINRTSLRTPRGWPFLPAIPV